MFQPGTYDPVFEEQAFSLPYDTAISTPFLTRRGFHLIKRLNLSPAVSGDSASATESMKARVSSDPRIRVAAERGLRKARQLAGYKAYPVEAATLDRYISGFESGGPSDPSALPAGTVLGSTSNAKFTVAAFGDWLNINLASLRQTNPPYTNTALLQRFLDQSLMQEYQLHLEKYNPAFAQQLNEFIDGNLIFEAMQREIWDKASNDEAGLQKYYATPQQQYRWGASFSGVLFTATDRQSIEKYITELKTNTAAWAGLLAPYSQTILPDSGRFELAQLEFSLPPTLAAGNIIEPVHNQESSHYQFVLLLKRYSAGEQRSLADAGGQVLSDYQQLLEEQWINRLKKKYPVSVNKAVLQTILP